MLFLKAALLTANRSEFQSSQNESATCPQFRFPTHSFRATPANAELTILDGGSECKK